VLIKRLSIITATNTNIIIIIIIIIIIVEVYGVYRLWMGTDSDKLRYGGFNRYAKKLTEPKNMK